METLVSQQKVCGSCIRGVNPAQRAAGHQPFVICAEKCNRRVRLTRPNDLEAEATMDTLQELGWVVTSLELG